MGLLADVKSLKNIEFIILLIAASIALFCCYTQFFSFQNNLIMYYTLSLIIVLCFFELRRNSLLEIDISKISEKLTDIYADTNKIAGISYRIGRIGDRWTWNINGTLLIGNTRNVTLRTKTIQILLDAFKDTPDYHKKLKESSKKVGISFSEDLKNELMQKRTFDPNSPQKVKIDQWINFDSDTGMGQFDIDKLSTEENNIHGIIRVKNSFIASDRSTGINECSFFEGYFEGIFERFVNVQVDIHEVSCISKKSEYCEFSVITKKP